jgi:hypothetical protein
MDRILLYELESFQRRATEGAPDVIDFMSYIEPLTFALHCSYLSAKRNTTDSKICLLVDLRQYH